MGKKQTKNLRRRGYSRRSTRDTAPRDNSEGTSTREAFDSRDWEKLIREAVQTRSSVISTLAELLQRINHYATCCAHFISGPANCAIAEHEKDGTYLLSIAIRFHPPSKLQHRPHLVQIGNENFSTCLGHSLSKKLLDIGKHDGTCSLGRNCDEETRKEITRPIFPDEEIPF